MVLGKNERRKSVAAAGTEGKGKALSRGRSERPDRPYGSTRFESSNFRTAAKRLIQRGRRRIARNAGSPFRGDHIVPWFIGNRHSALDNENRQPITGRPPIDKRSRPGSRKLQPCLSQTSKAARMIRNNSACSIIIPADDARVYTASCLLGRLVLFT